MSSAVFTNTNWFVAGFRSAAAMVWMTFWPLVLGFLLSGVTQSFLRRDALRRSLGRHGIRPTATATLLGVISSSCSYAASAMARALVLRGATFSNAMVFMVASTNLVIELGVVLYVMLGGQFLAAQIIGGIVMVAILAVVLPRMFPRELEDRLRAEDSSPASAVPAGSGWKSAVGWSRAARYCMGDLRMLRKELAFGFIVAGFIAADVPTSWGRTIFIPHHGAWTVLENVLIAPAIAVVSFVCSVGNIPLAAALWARGVSFGGVVAFIFADLITLPLVLIYRRFYGTRAAVKILLVFWATMSVTGVVVQALFSSPHPAPAISLPYIAGTFDLGSTLILNVVAAVALLVAFVLSRRHLDATTAIDPICGMQVEIASAAATISSAGDTYYFCSPGCRDRFAAQSARAEPNSSDGHG